MTWVQGPLDIDGLVDRRQATFGATSCEISVEVNPRHIASPYTAWAFRFDSERKLQPIFEVSGAVVRRHGASIDEAIASVSSALAALFGDERIGDRDRLT